MRCITAGLNLGLLALFQLSLFDTRCYCYRAKTKTDLLGRWEHQTDFGLVSSCADHVVLIIGTCTITLAIITLLLVSTKLRVEKLVTSAQQ